MFEKLLRNLTRILVAIGMASLMGIVITIIVNVIARYIFKRPLLWSLELCSILVVWATYILFGVDYQKNRHFRIEVITKLLPTKALQVLDVIVDVLLFVTVIVLAISTWSAVQLNGRMILIAIPVSLWIAFYIPFTIGVLTHLLYLIVKTVLRFKKTDANEIAGEGAR